MIWRRRERRVIGVNGQETFEFAASEAWFEACVVLDKFLDVDEDEGDVGVGVDEAVCRPP